MKPSTCVLECRASKIRVYWLGKIWSCSATFEIR